MYSARYCSATASGWSSPRWWSPTENVVVGAHAQADDVAVGSRLTDRVVLLVGKLTEAV
ncbi:hypothetical protein [Streptomonospora arabica]|uniref:Uncharacterized protein n=1 Tax=Streptomonospora arabica TaxID=412417 RepID=A0ABV9SK58_9ACTN